MAKSLYKIAMAHLEDTRNFHKGMLELHEEDSPAHALHKAAMEASAERMAECTKAEIADGLSKRTILDDEQRRNAKVQATDVSAVTPDNPNFVRAIPRHGQPQIPERPNVPLEFEKIFAIDEDQ